MADLNKFRVTTESGIERLFDTEEEVIHFVSSFTGTRAWFDEGPVVWCDFVKSRNEGFEEVVPRDELIQQGLEKDYEGIVPLVEVIGDE